MASVVEGCVAAEGGGLHLVDCASLLNASQVRGCNASRGSGGGVAVHQGSLVAVASILDANTALANTALGSGEGGEGGEGGGGEGGGLLLNATTSATLDQVRVRANPNPNPNPEPNPNPNPNPRPVHAHLQPRGERWRARGARVPGGGAHEV